MLWKKDELLQYIKDPNEFLNRFQEKKLNFMPTYKFIKKSHLNEYDEKRPPAWCDRILYEEKVPSTINQLCYQDVDINLSDHKPVLAVFEVKVKKIELKEDYQMKFNQLKKKYYEINQD